MSADIAMENFTDEALQRLATRATGDHGVISAAKAELLRHGVTTQYN
jgi:hypothetical protein